ncbi:MULTISPECIES: YgiQ family radical SAM protein [Clostridium]|uniref:YgiQ family radical SAM protein n=1 Tax=Clostridium beijerinckii TaxID=1520 RepID=A0A1S9N627_CLOBE|nr:MULTISPECIES: YgiQ family radical SAM protein [Clostridium]MBN7572901.1 YgiQ family radical SAM protein [Clostridium beijerinckii]MBN7578297.1 YgiQ family radical SAM protein [Clostridium beijerinckii]MBN7582675.1 YgiQ family radical SAM protein [Clostridium beijerinckii]MBO0520403.1 YgiQ family radical SAM protein [Clostridium beijerinckii]MZK51740.1 YgiQ family radical SAM protein [Clostridium beijerinckii]
MKLCKEFLPISKEDLKKRKIDQLDFIIVSGDAYVDHPSFGTAIIGRTLEAQGFNVGIIAQPNWHSSEDFKKLGKPKYGFLVNSGNIDSMVNHYTAAKKTRREDLYSPGGEAGHRPDRSIIVYCNRIREAYKDAAIAIGGIEASLRRFAHYDYWDNKVRRSILVDSKADLLMYGMGEKTVVQIAELLRYGANIKNITSVRGTCYLTKDISNIKNAVIVPSFEEVSTDKEAYGEAYKLEYYEQDSINGRTIIQQYGDRYLVQNPPQENLTQEEMDMTYDLPYTRTYHPIYEEKGGIPAIQEVKFSITSHRGCFGSCSFCALTFHQGRVIQNRGQDSIIDEAKLLTTLPDFKGYIHDIGGPTANFRHRACKKQIEHGTCKNKQCMFPSPCKNLIIDHTEYLSLLKKVRKLPRIKKVFIRSGLRYDYLIHDKNDAFFKELCEHHISGQLKVAPEHVVPKVLNQMGKPTREVYDKFVNKYFQINKQIDKKQFLVPYLMSSHPGSDLNAAIDLALYIKEMGYTPEQVQDFYPTPGSLSTTMYYTGFNPITGEKVYIPKTPEEKEMQRALIQFAVPKNYQKVKKALLKAHREDLIGNGKNCLIGFTPGKLGYQGKHKSNDGPRNNSSKNSSASKMSNEKNSISNTKKNSTNGNKKHSNKHSSDNYSNRRKRTI